MSFYVVKRHVVNFEYHLINSKCHSIFVIKWKVIPYIISFGFVAYKIFKVGHVSSDGRESARESGQVSALAFLVSEFVVFVSKKQYMV